MRNFSSIYIHVGHALLEPFEYILFLTLAHSQDDDWI